MTSNDRIRSVVISGRPVPKARPRVYGRHAVTPQRTLDAEHRLRDEYIRQNGPCRPFTGKVLVDCVFYAPVPKSWPKAKRQQALEGKLAYTSRPDIDNLVKLVLDVLNGTAYEDDAQITGLSAQKVYGGLFESGGTVVMVEEISETEE